MADPRFKRGARKSPRYKLAAAIPHSLVAVAAPPQAAFVPKHLDMWGNNVHGDCVTAEEAFAKACYAPEIYISADVVMAWASAHGVLEGADLVSVMEWMKKQGFRDGSQLYNDGDHYSVDYSSEDALQSAIAAGPVKIAIDADALPQSAGNQQGWQATGNGHFTNTDHCVAICGYGPTTWLYQQLGVVVPSVGLPAVGYLVFTWSTIGFVDHAWLMGTCVEAWVRRPTTIGAPPLDPTPPPPPMPPDPTNAPLFKKTFTRKVPKGGMVSFMAPTDIPKGSLLEVFAPIQVSPDPQRTEDSPLD